MAFLINKLPKSITIGKVGENSFRTIEIDIGEWLKAYPEAEFSILYSRPDKFVYFVDATRSEKIVSWTPNADDLSVRGIGSIEIKMELNGVVGKSEIVIVKVEESIEPSGLVPSPYYSWFHNIIETQIRLEKMLKEVHMERLNIEKIAPYLYNGYFYNLNYEAGSVYYKERYKGPYIGSCSVVSKGNLVGRNYDFNYDERQSFVVHSPASNGRHAVIGVASSRLQLTADIIESGEYTEEYELVPFCLLDGVNDAGVFCEINVAPFGDYGLTTGTNPDGEDLSAGMITRYVLDYAASVDEAIELLRNRNIYSANSEAMRSEFHFLIKDKTKTVVLEFINNQLNVIESFVDNKEIMTNFYLHGFDGSRQSLTPYAMGFERYGILAEGYNNVDSLSDMLSLMETVKYSKAYNLNQDTPWYSEFTGDHGEQYGNLTIDSPVEDYIPYMRLCSEFYSNRIRNGVTWHTVHTACYDLSERKLVVVPQESGVPYAFRLDSPGVIYGSEFSANSA